MADFFLARKGYESTLEYVKEMQHKRGFDKFKEFQLTCGRLVLFQKQLVNVENYYIGDHVSVFSVGTLAYKGLSYSESLKAISIDYTGSVFSSEFLRGEFILIIEDGKKTVAIRDNTGMYKLFSDLEDRFLTTSFFSAISCTECTFNEMALAEQFMYGFVSAPDTLVQEIKCVAAGRYEEEKDWFCWGEKKPVDQSEQSRNINTSVFKQKREIESYLSDVTNLVSQYKCECGLSGGCDSRLIYFSVNSVCGKMTSVHTHKTSEGHNKEIKVVNDITKIYNTPVVIIPTVHLMDCEGDEIDTTMRELVLFFDGRNAETIGSCNQTYTKWYREKTAAGNGITFSGIAGEIYRDFYYTKLKRFKIKAWLEDRIFQKHINRVIPQKLYDEAADHIIDKINYFTDSPKKTTATASFAKRYFDQYRIPNALGNVVHANNQMNFFLAPFTDAKIIAAAKPDAVYQDHCGEYEGKIMKAFSEIAPDIMSSKGYAYSHIPFLIRMKWNLRSVSPLWLRKTITHILDKPNDNYKNEFINKFPKSSYITAAMKYFTSKYPEWNMEPLQSGDIYINPFIFSVCTIYEIHNSAMISKD